MNKPKQIGCWVKWEDSHSKDGWIDRKEAMNFARDTTCKCYSCGMIASETKKFLTLTIGGASTGQMLHMIKIPKSAIISRRDMRLKAKKK